MAEPSCSRFSSGPSASAFPECGVEVLVPDFQGSHAAMDIVLDASPDVLNHNTETVPGCIARSAWARATSARSTCWRMRSGSGRRSPPSPA